MSPRWRWNSPITANTRDVGERGNNDSLNFVDNYFLANLQVILQPKDRLKLLQAANNVFDEDYSYPECIRQRIDEILGEPGRAAHFNAEFAF